MAEEAAHLMVAESTAMLEASSFPLLKTQLIIGVAHILARPLSLN